MQLVIGIDFDNTIIDYDDVVYDKAFVAGLIPAHTPKNKTIIRDQIRLLANGEEQWTRLQADVYGRSIAAACLNDGVADFFSFCKANKIKTVIVSHKTQYAKYDEGGIDLRQASLKWMETNQFFAPQGFALSVKDVYFESTRQEKVQTIRRLACTHFIDDLEEVFYEPSFPSGVVKMLYNPAPSTTVPIDWCVYTNWKEIITYFLTVLMPPNELDLSIIAALWGYSIDSTERIGGGRNSQVFLLTSKTRNQANKVVVKRYFHSPNDQRDRLGVEFSSLSFMWENGVRSVPQPLLAAREHGCALYEFIEGYKLVSNQIGEAEIDQTVQFLATLQALRAKPAALKLPPASEAFFSIQGILENITMRLSRLDAVGCVTPLHADMHAFLDEKLRPTLMEASQRCSEYLSKQGKTLQTELTQEQRILSPSDFGFHNALLRPNGQLAFLDFEYFGWDDPAKTITDFLLHPNPAMDLSAHLKIRFADALFSLLAADHGLQQRFQLLFPLFGVKWCIILLNEFLKEDYQRRSFAMKELKVIEFKDILLKQLLLANKNYDKIRTWIWGYNVYVL